MDDIAGWRNRIDEIDSEIIGLLNKRAEYAVEIGKVKRQSGSDIYDPKREQYIYNRIMGLNTGPLDDDTLVTIFKCIIEECRSKESRETE